MSKEAEKLSERCRLISKTLVHVNARAGAVEWMADASGLLFDSASLLRRQAEQIRELREALRICAGWVEAYGQPETRAIVRAALSNTKEEA